jgi:glycosyltransferase involved in cell wall biosynthesis
MKESVSISLCTYNGAKYLLEQLESFLAQTRLPDELVVCDDGSQDETVSILRAFEPRAPFPVRFYRNETNLGVAKNFEKAISLCHGDITFLSDQDDVWAPKKIARMMVEFEKDSSVGQVFTDAELVDEHLEVLGQNLWEFTFPEDRRRVVEEDSLFSVLLKFNVVTGATQAFRTEHRSLFFPIPDYKPYLIHDGWIALIISMIAKSVCVEERLIKYRQHDGQMLGIKRGTPPKQKLYWNGVLNHWIDVHSARQQYLEHLADHTRRRIPQSEKYLSGLNSEIEFQSEMVNHLHVRRKLLDYSFRRVSTVAGELCRGRYHRFSNGIRSVMRDLSVTRDFVIQRPDEDEQDRRD